MKFEGLYKWKLIDKNTGEIVSEGEQKNLMTDSFVNAFDDGYEFRNSYFYGRIVLSKQAVPLPPAEYRELGVALANISKDYVTGNLTKTIDIPAGIMKVSYNFAPPVSTETITIIGYEMSGTSYYHFVSFVVLTTPITRTSTQYLYVEYSITSQYAGGLLNAPDNAYIRSVVNSEIYRFSSYMAYRTNQNHQFVRITPFREPAVINNVARSVSYPSYIQVTTAPNNGCRYGQDVSRTYTSTEIVGPIGCPAWSYYDDFNSPYQNYTLGYFDTNIAPSVSRVYIHPDTYKEQVFSDPAHPATSRASITVSGTPTCKFPIIVRLKITKTGDASDIVDETFTANPSTEELTVSHDDWAVDDIVRFTTTNTLPSPLAIDTDYYIITKTGSSPTVLITVSLSQGGSVVNITDTGLGTHTIIRQNTGRYRLTMEPCPSTLTSNVNTRYIEYRQILGAVDPDGNNLSYNRSSVIPALIGREGDYIYTVQYNADNTKLAIYRQYMYSIESSVALHSVFGTSGVSLWCAVRGKGTYVNNVYIATSDGIYEYDLSAPATPTLMTITGMLATEVFDLAFDEITEYLWAGHSNGLSRINLGTNVATQYINGTSNPLEGLTNDQIICHPGTLTAHNGYVLHARIDWPHIWLLLDGTGYSLNTTLSVNYGATINKSNGYIVARTYNSSRWATYNVTGITGINTGTWNVIEFFNTGYATDSGRVVGTVLQLSNNKFICYVPYSNSSTAVRCELYTVGVGVTQRSPAVPGLFNFSDSIVPDRRIANTRVGLDVSEGLELLSQIQWYGGLICYSEIIEYGWTGSAWDKNNTSDRQITKTGSDSLGNGITVQFNNAVGEDWDQQFVVDEYFTFMIAPVFIKDNLQEYTVKTRNYYCAVKRVVNWTAVVPVGLTITVPEAPTGSSPDADYRDLETLDWILDVYNVTSATTMAQVGSSPGDEEYSVVGLLDGTFTFNVNQQGDTIRFTYNYTCYY